MADVPESRPSREQVWAGLQNSADGMRDLQQFLDSIKDFDDAAFAEATGGSDRAELMELLERLNTMLGELDNLTAQLHPDVN